MGSALSLVIARTPEPAISPGAIYAKLWAGYLQDMQVFRTTLQQVRKEERDAFELEDDWSFAFQEHDSYKKMELETARAITIRLVGKAVDLFTPPGCSPIRIAAEAYVYKYVDSACESRETGRYRAQPECFDPAALWDDLVCHFGTRETADTAYIQAARRFVELFGLSNKAVRRRGAGISLNLRIYTDGFEAKSSPTKRLDWGSSNVVVEALSQLETFAAWSGDDTGLASALTSAKRRFGAIENKIRSREKIPLGGSATVTTYFTRFEFVFGAELSEKLQVFIGQYGQGEDET